MFMNRKIKTSTKIIFCILAIVLILGGYTISVRNKLVSQEQEAISKFSNIQVCLQRRNDLIPNLVSTVKGYAQQEQNIFNEVANARSNMLNAKTSQDMIEADAVLSQAVGRLLAVAEAYPELKSNENFLSLQDELAGTENRIAVARKDYNEIANKFNVSIRLFPKNIVAKMFTLNKLPLFQAEEAANVVPIVNF